MRVIRRARSEENIILYALKVIKKTKDTMMIDSVNVDSEYYVLEVVCVFTQILKYFIEGTFTRITDSPRVMSVTISI